MKEGSGVRFDQQGFPVLDEEDPVMQAARKSKVPPSGRRSPHFLV